MIQQLPTSINEISELQEQLIVQKNILLDKALRSDVPSKIIEAAKYF